MNSVARIQSLEMSNAYLRHKLDRVEKDRDSLAEVRQALQNMAEDLEETGVDLKENLSEQEEILQTRKLEAVGSLAGGIAHHFNNAMAGMIGYLHLARMKSGKDVSTIGNINQVEKIIFNTAELIKQLLSFAGREMVRPEPIQLTSFIGEEIDGFRTSLGMEMRLEYSHDTERIPILADRKQLQQVLSQLINNARDAVEGVEEPHITIRIETLQADNTFIEKNLPLKVGPYAHLSVKDNGCGIPEDKIELLFEPFFTSKEIGQGTGLGLAMVYGAVKTHHGTINVESTEGEGSTFHVYLPVLQKGAESVI